MEDKLLRKNKQEWELFQAQSRDALQEIFEGEEQLRAVHSVQDGKLPEHVQEQFRQHRKSWIEEWGAKGRQMNGMLNRHAKREMEFLQVPGQQQPMRMLVGVDEAHKTVRLPQGYSSENFTEAAIEDLYRRQSERSANAEANAHFPDRMQIDDNEDYIGMHIESEFLIAHYESQDEPVPQATLKRMDKRIASYYERWHGIEHDVPASEIKTLSEEDLRQEGECWNQLMNEHNLIERSYGGLKEIPVSSREQMVMERQEFQAEVSSWHQQQEQAAEVQAPAQSLAQSFQEQVEVIRRKQAERPKLKGPG